eukprot:TRINITY_DN3994_c0_g1_i1.p1 TRINITY_DN3994_c0_g1~~TRINITY_DN3994_c0_g1_i1.p1  ORF type:complete len:272 (+),score=104.89 TRINITY_DN3994_c0_g1_i1:439-1254(+)
MSEAVVIVENLTRVEKLADKLKEFLNFCGPISKLTIHKSEGKETNYAVVTFTSGSAARTAILMNNTPFEGSTVTVKAAPAGFVVPEADDEDQRPPVAAPVETASPLSGPEAIFELVLKQGAELTNAALEQAKALDQQHQISATIGALTEQAVQQAQAKFTEIDNELHITTKVTELTQQIEGTVSAITEQATALEQQYKIKETADGVFAATGVALTGLATEATKIAEQISEDPKVKEGIAALDAFSKEAEQTVAQAVGAAMAAAPTTAPTTQ